MTLAAEYARRTMTSSHCLRTPFFVSRIAAVVVACVLIPQVVAETHPECETSVAVQRESMQLAESCSPMVCHGQLDGELHAPGHRAGPAALIGHEGRWLNATLLAPLRC